MQGGSCSPERDPTEHRLWNYRIILEAPKDPGDYDIEIQGVNGKYCGRGRMRVERSH